MQSLLLPNAAPPRSCPPVNGASGASTGDWSEEAGGDHGDGPGVGIRERRGHVLRPAPCRGERCRPIDRLDAPSSPPVLSPRSAASPHRLDDYYALVGAKKVLESAGLSLRSNAMEKVRMACMYIYIYIYYAPFLLTIPRFHLYLVSAILITSRLTRNEPVWSSASAWAALERSPTALRIL